jgi:PAS domain S-box-containing protein
MEEQDKNREEFRNKISELLSSADDVRVDPDSLEELQHALRRNQDRFELALNAAELGLWDYDLQTGEAFVSRGRATMLGYSLEEVEPHISSWGKLVHPDDMDRVFEAFNAHAEGRVPFYECEHRLRCKSGEYKWVLARAKIVERDRHGNPMRLVGVSFDVSERKRATGALKDYADGLEKMVEERTGELGKINDELRKEIEERKRAHEESQELIARLQKALSEVKTLSGLIPICASCKKIRDDKGYWRRVEEYIRAHSEAKFSHSICPDCTKRLYPEMNMRP